MMGMIQGVPAGAQRAMAMASKVPMPVLAAGGLLAAGAGITGGAAMMAMNRSPEETVYKDAVAAGATPQEAHGMRMEAMKTRQEFESAIDQAKLQEENARELLNAHLEAM